MRVGEYYKDLDGTHEGFKIIKLTPNGAMVLWDSEKRPMEIFKESFDRWLKDKETGIELILGFNDYYKQTI